MEMTGTGTLAGFARSISMQVAVVIDYGPRLPGDAVQTFPANIVSIQGSLFGDPDFDLINFRSGSNFGSPQPGVHYIDSSLGPPGSDFQVDSFFDIFYEIDFQGAPGSVLDGFAGTTADIDTLSTFTPGSGTGFPTGTDNCDTDIEYGFIDNTVLTGNCPIVQIITRTWVGTDDCGNTSVPCTQIIDVTDTTPPQVIPPSKRKH